MKVLVTGVNGQLGYDVMNEVARRGWLGIGSGRTAAYSGLCHTIPVTQMPYVSLNITDGVAVRQRIGEIRPDVVIHCAAWTAVDQAEMPENSDAVWAVNVQGTRYIAEACRDIGCKMIYVSTDYVFDGQGTLPWVADSHSCQPVNAYGESKLAGEQAVSSVLEKYFIVRISWVFGKSGNNFVKTMLRLGKQYDTLRVVNDQIGRPTYTSDLARLLVDMAETDAYGYYHATNEGPYISWYEFAREIFRQAGYTVQVTPVTTAQYGATGAVRPYNSRLDTSKLEDKGFQRLPDWRDAVGRYLYELGIHDAKQQEVQ